MLAVDHLAADEPLQARHPPAECGCREREFLRRRLDRSKAGDLNKGLQGRKGRQSTHKPSCSSGRSAATRHCFFSNGAQTGSKHPSSTEQQNRVVGKMQKLQLLYSFRTCENTSDRKSTRLNSSH